MHQSLSVLVSDCANYPTKTMGLVNNAFHMLPLSLVVLVMIATTMSVSWGILPSHSSFDHVRNVWFNLVPFFSARLPMRFASTVSDVSSAQMSCCGRGGARRQSMSIQVGSLIWSIGKGK